MPYRVQSIKSTYYTRTWTILVSNWDNTQLRYACVSRLKYLLKCLP